MEQPGPTKAYLAKSYNHGYSWYIVETFPHAESNKKKFSVLAKDGRVVYYKEIKSV